MAVDISPEALDFAALLRPGDRMVWGQAAAEPLTLTERLFAQAAAVPGLSAFIGMSWGTPPAEGPGLAFRSYCGTGLNRALERAGRLDILPCHYSELAGVLAPQVDVLLLSLAADGAGGFSFGAAHEYLVPLVGRARLVIAEVNDATPFTFGERTLAAADIDIIVRTARPLAPPPKAAAGPADAAIARHVAGLVEDGAVLQIGIGSLPETILAALAGHRDLGLHSGLVSEGVVDLIEAGALTNARKSLDTGISIAGLAGGGPRLMAHVHRNPRFAFRSTAYTHGQPVLAALERFTAINSAVEVDLSGQINAEVAGGRYVGAVGGAADFLRGARASRGGLPIVALPATVAAGGTVTSRIVERLSGPVSTARADAGIIVTEHGVADLRGLGLSERRKRLIAIAAPEFRAALEEGSPTRSAA